MHLSGNMHHRSNSTFFLLCIGILLVVFALTGADIADACPGCKDALSENDPQHARMVRGYFWSILFMMAMPFTIAGTFGTFFYLEFRRKRSAEQAAAQTVDELAEELVGRMADRSEDFFS